MHKPTHAVIGQGTPSCLLKNENIPSTSENVNGIPNAQLRKHENGPDAK